MKNLFALLIAYILLSSTSITINGQSFVRGVVYADLNKNNIWDHKEKGIARVPVSNGKDIVLTNAKGEYTLPVANDNIIFIIKPASYDVPVNANNLPLFYYIHKPNGSPELKYAGVPPTGPLPASVDFPLIPATVKDSFRVLVFGDPQPYSPEEVSYFHKGIISELKGVQGVDFGISMGDLVGDNLDLHKLYIEAVKDIGIPWCNVMGNHDENYDVKADSLSDETFEQNFGPATYAFNHGKAHFIILDDILYPDPRDGKGYWGGFRNDQLEFIKNDLSLVPKDHLVILAFHIPISELEGGDPFNDEDRLKLFELLRDYPHTLTLSAHTHFQSQDFFTSADGWIQPKRHHHYNVGTTCGDWYSGRLDAHGVPFSTMRDGTPKGYAFLNINGNQYTIDYKVAGQSPDYRIGIYAPKVVEQNRSTSAGIYANYFMGSATDTLYCRIDDGPWKVMQFTNDYDPAYLHLLHEYDFAEELLDGRRPSNPVFCNHLWRIGIPTRLPAGEHIIEIKVTDMFGRVITQQSSYRIAAK
ncbi:MAG: calcineurin-like phosphoesterase family protein [Bacteroidales bacterium]